MKPRLSSWFALGLLTGCFLVIGASLATPVIAEEDGEEHYRANLIGMNGRGGSTQVEILIRRWTTDEQRADLTQVIMNNDPRALARAVRNQDSIGWLQPRSQRAYQLRYSRQYAGENGARTIVLATDRPIGMREATGTTQSMDFSVTLVVFQVDAEGNGEGQLSVGNEILFDEATNKLNITNAGSQPIRMTGIRRLGK